MTSDNLILNDDKSEFLILSTRQQLVKVNIDNIKVDSANVSPVPVVRNLGLWFDPQPGAHYPEPPSVLYP